MFNGHGYIYEFENGFGASVVKHDGSYGGKRDYTKSQYLTPMVTLCYTTPITDDVIGYASEETVYETLDRIKSL